MDPADASGRNSRRSAGNRKECFVHLCEFSGITAITYPIWRSRSGKASGERSVTEGENTALLFRNSMKYIRFAKKAFNTAKQH